MLFGGGFGHIGKDLAEVLKGVTFDRVDLSIHAFNTDLEDLAELDELDGAIKTVQIGIEATEGCGAGADRKLGEKAAQENKEDILAPMKEADILIMGACLGGGTGSGSLPFAAKEFLRLTKNQENVNLPKKKAGLLIVTLPFSSQDTKVHQTAQDAYDELLLLGIPIIPIYNDRFLPKTDADMDMPIVDMWKAGNKLIGYMIARTARALGQRHDIWNIDRNDIVGHLLPKPEENHALSYFGIGYINEDGTIADALKQASQNSYLDTGLWSCRRAIVSVDATQPTAKDFQDIQQFMQTERKTLDAEWRCGINGSFKPLPFEKENGYKAAVFILGTGCELGAKKFVDPDAIPMPELELVADEPLQLAAAADVASQIVKTPRLLNEEEVERQYKASQLPPALAS